MTGVNGVGTGLPTSSSSGISITTPSGLGSLPDLHSSQQNQNYEPINPEFQNNPVENEFGIRNPTFLNAFEFLGPQINALEIIEYLAVRGGTRAESIL